jgi:hypothetical protein
MTMSDEERQRLRQVERATEELADALDFQQQALEATRAEILSEMEGGIRRIGALFEILVEDIREDRKALRKIEERLDNG